MQLKHQRSDENSKSKQELSNVLSTSIMHGKPIEFDFKQEASSTINTGQLRLAKQITDPNDINLDFNRQNHQENRLRAPQ